jgi:demethylspheroidene O-methyltransferase
MAGAAAGRRGAGLLKRGATAFRAVAAGRGLLGVPGLEAMVRHHPCFYRDLADPVAFLRARPTPSWRGSGPMSLGGRPRIRPEGRHAIRDLMADSQALVAEDTLRTGVASAASRT